MTVDEYINNVTFKIKNKSTRKSVEKELRDCIDDRKDSYIAMGYDEDTATQKAIERMGNGEIVGEQFNQLYNKKIIDCLHFFVIFSDIIILIFFLIGKLFFLNNIFQCQQDFNIIAFTTEAWLICIFLSSFVLSVVTKRKSVLYVPFISMSIFTLYYTISKASPLVIYIYFLLCKKAEHLELLTSTLYNENTVKFSFLTVVSFIFYFVLFALFIICLKLVNDFIKCRFSKKDIIITKAVIFISTCIALLVLIVCLSDFKCQSENSEMLNMVSRFNGIYVIQSNDIKDFENLDFNDKSKIELPFGNNQHNTDLSFKSNTVNYNRFLEYKKLTIAFSCQKEQKYIAVIPYSVDEVYYEQGKWYDLENTDIINDEIFDLDLSLFSYEITVSS